MAGAVVIEVHADVEIEANAAYLEMEAEAAEENEAEEETVVAFDGGEVVAVHDVVDLHDAEVSVNLDTDED